MLRFMLIVSAVRNCLLKMASIVVNQLKLFCYKSKLYKRVIFLFLCLLTCGLLFLWSCWNKVIYIKLTHETCHPNEATAIIIIDKENHEKSVVYTSRSDSKIEVKEKHVNGLEYKLTDSEELTEVNEFKNERTSIEKVIACSYTIYFEYQFYRYFIIESEIIPIPIYEPKTLSQEKFIDENSGLTLEENAKLKSIFLENLICVPKRSYLSVFLRLIANPFYAFQLATVILWSIEQYYIFSSFIVIASLTTILITTITTKREHDRLRNMVSGGTQIEVRRKQNQNEIAPPTIINSHDLVPGDLITISEDIIFPCDAILVNGTCVVNESMLTGESVPVFKTPQTIDEIRAKEDVTENTQHIIYNGTHVLQAKSTNHERPTQAIVMRTGFATLKGGLIRQLILPKRIDFLYYSDFFKFILCLALPALAASAISFYNFLQIGVPLGHVIIRALSIITLMIPPDLPIVLAVSLLLAARHLRQQNISCIELPRISLAGRISCFCFDKTGTLTESDLILDGVIECNTDKKFNHLSKEFEDLKSDWLIQAMGCCHSLVSINNKIEGDSLEKEMFDFVKGEVSYDTAEEKRITSFKIPEKENRQQIEVIKIFPFESSLGRMSCITMDTENGECKAFCKGSPEVLSNLCIPESIPGNYEQIVEKYSKEGSRILAVAGKAFPSAQNDGYTRGDVESKLNFLGLLVFQNVCKEETKPALCELRRANIRTVMVTGDHLLTAVHIAKDCGMIDANYPVYKIDIEADSVPSYQRMDSNDEAVIQQANQLPSECHVVLTGEVFQLLHDKYPDSFERVLLYGTVFARMSPDQKAELMCCLKRLDYCVAMCGDGANDCGALKAADVGISLCEAEASVASSFTSKTPNIACCLKLIKDGRSSIVTTTMLLSIIMLGAFLFSSFAVLLSTLGVGLSDFGQIYAYFFQFVPFSITMILATPNPILRKKKPRFALFRLDLIVTMLVVIAWYFGSFYFIYNLLQAQTWYKPPSAFDNTGLLYNFYAYEHNITMNTLLLELPLMVLIFYAGLPHREPFYKNKIHLFLVVVSAILGHAMVLFPWPHFNQLFKLVVIPSFRFKIYMVLLNIGTSVVAYAIWHFGNNSKNIKKIFNFIRRKKESRMKYKRLIREIENESTSKEKYLLA